MRRPQSQILSMRRISYGKKKVWEKAVGRRNRMCEGCRVGRGGKGFEFCPKGSERLLDNYKQVGNKKLWIELCPSRKRYVGVLNPRTSEYDLT